MHHLIGKEIIRFHCVYWPAMLLAAGLEPPHRVHVHGWLLLGGEKLSKTVHGPAKLTDIAPARLVEDFGVDGFRYHFLRDVPFGPDGDFSYERMVDRYNADLANNLGNLLVPRRHRRRPRSATASVPRRAPTARSPRVAAEALRRRRRAAWDDVAAVGRPRGDVAARARDERPARGERAVEGRARPRGRRACSATPSRRCASSPCWRRPAIPAAAAEIWRRIGLPGSPDGPAAARRGGVGRLPGRPPRREGRPALPPQDLNWG